MYLKTKLTLTSFEITQLSITKIILKRTNETFNLVLPDVNVHNYIVGSPYLWFKGDMVCTNETTGDVAYLNFKAKGWTSKSDYVANGWIKSKTGDEKYVLSGFWNEFLEATHSVNKGKVTLATKHPDPINKIKQFSLTYFALRLNQLTYDMLEKIAPTDSRLRPDLRAFEYQDIDLASKEKTRLEEKQRARRKEMQLSGVEHKPLWFDFVLEGDKMTSKFKGEYFKVREKRAWPKNTPDLFLN
jgi:hypothetical protein